MFREAFNKILGTGALREWGDTKDAKMYLDLYTPGKYFYYLKSLSAPAFKKLYLGKK